MVLRQENDSLKTENYRLQAALRSLMCPNCGGPAMLGDMAYDEQQLRLENARLKDEVHLVNASEIFYMYIQLRYTFVTSTRKLIAY